MAVHGTRRRDSVSWDHAGLLKLLAGLARDRTSLPVLRCYWYETAEGRRTAEHDALAEMPGLKLRLVNARPGRREGIESQFRRDLVTLAKSGAISDAFIASADEHLAEIVSEVQDLGLRVVVLHITSDNGWTIPQPLRQECDDIVEISGVHLRPFVDLIRGAEPSLPQDQSYLAASAVPSSDESLARMPADGALNRAGLPAQALPAAVSAYQPAPAGSGYAQLGQQPYGGMAEQSAAAAAYQPVPVAREAGAPHGSNGAGHHAAHAASAPPASQFGNGRSEQGVAGEGVAGEQAYGSAQFGPGRDERGQARDGAVNGSVQSGQPNGAGQVAAGPAGNSGQFPVLPSGGAPDDPSLNGHGQPGPVPAGGAYGAAANAVVLNGAVLAGAAASGGPVTGGAVTGGAVTGGTATGSAAVAGLGNGSVAHGRAVSARAAGSAPNGMTAGYSRSGDGSGSAQAAYTTRPQQVFVAPPGDVAKNASVPGGYQTSAVPGGYQSQALPAGYQQAGSRPNGASGHHHDPGQNGVAPDANSRLAGSSGFGPYQGYQSNGAVPGAHSANGGLGMPGDGSAMSGAGNSGQFHVLPPAGQPGAASNGAAYGGMMHGGAANDGSVSNSGAGNGSAVNNGAQPSSAFQAAPVSGPPPAPGHPLPGRSPAGYSPTGQQPTGGQQPAGGQPSVGGQPPVGRQTPLPGQAQPYYPANPPYPGGQVVPGRDQVVTGREQASLSLAARGAAPAYPSQQYQPPPQYQPQQNQPQQNQPQPQQYQAQPYQAQQYQQYQPQLSSALPAVRPAQPMAVSLPDAVKAAHNEGFTFGESVSRDAPGLWLEAVLARKPRMPSDLEARLLQGSVLPIDSLLHDEVRHSLRRGFWDALESAMR
ncbi:MAG: hypothetical protein ACR2FU_19165 [Streptosporangiaceae bacterium]